MHWELSDEQEMFATALRDWTQRRFPLDSIKKLLSTGDSRAFTAALVSEGWWGVGYPESAGGQGGAMLELCLAAREFGRAAAPASAWLATAVVAPALSAADLAAAVAGDRVFVAAVDANIRPAAAPAVRLVDGRVTGSIDHVLAAGAADVFVVPAIGDGDRVLVRVAAGDTRRTADNLLDRSRSAATVSFEDAAASPVDLDAAAALRSMGSRAAILVAADALGGAERMLELSVEYSKQRKQFGRPIGSFQAVKHAAAQMLVTVEAAYSIAVYAAAAADAGLDDVESIAAAAKAQVGESVARLADSALTVHGAIGYTWEHELQLHYKRAKLNRALFGTPRAWNDVLADALLPAP